MMYVGANITIGKLVCNHEWRLFAGGGWHLFTGEVVFQRCKQMPYDGDAPGPAQELLSGTASHVGHVCVVDREAKDPAGK